MEFQSQRGAAVTNQQQWQRYPLPDQHSGYGPYIPQHQRQIISTKMLDNSVRVESFLPSLLNISESFLFITTATRVTKE